MLPVSSCVTCPSVPRVCSCCCSCLLPQPPPPPPPPPLPPFTPLNSSCKSKTNKHTGLKQNNQSFLTLCVSVAAAAYMRVSNIWSEISQEHSWHPHIFLKHQLYSTLLFFGIAAGGDLLLQQTWRCQICHQLLRLCLAPPWLLKQQLSSTLVFFGIAAGVDLLLQNTWRCKVARKFSGKNTLHLHIFWNNKSDNHLVGIFKTFSLQQLEPWKEKSQEAWK